METTVEKYIIKSEGIQVPAIIKKDPKLGLVYTLKLPDFEKATLALLDEVKQQLVKEVHVSAAEVLDPKVIKSLRIKFKERTEEILKEKLPNIDDKTKKFLVGKLLHEMLGLGMVELLLLDENIEEVVINSASEPVRIYHKKYGWLLTTLSIESEMEIQNFSNTIARRVGRQITTLNPLLDAHLVTGDRANAVLYPIAQKGNNITIRKFARDPWTVTDFIRNKTCPSEIFALVWLAIQFEMNVLISGGTASGKTSLLGVCLPFIPPNQRIITIEDTRELELPEFLYWCPLTTREPNPEGKGGITMLDLLINSLRMRPDRIILGEIREQKDAEVLFEAMHTGHSVYATVHADTTNQTIQRLTTPPINVPPNLLAAVHLNLVMFRDRRRGIRRIYQLGEFIPSESAEQNTVNSNILFRYRAGDDEIVPHSEPLRFFEELNRHTGMDRRLIMDDLDEKKRILEWMVKKNLRHISEVGQVMHEYYVDKEHLMKRIKGK
jgi:flagellar protein FlaI